jgi:hypothetical protein
MLELEEAVARFFPSGKVYDREAAKKLIASARWTRPQS